MDGPADILVAEHNDHPLDLAPAAEMDDVADLATDVGQTRRFGRSVVPKPLDEARRFGQGRAVGEMNVVTQLFPPIFVREAAFSRAKLRYRKMRG